MDDLLTTRQLQELLQVDRITIYRMLNDGRLRGFKVGGQWRFSRQEIETWLLEQQNQLALAGHAAQSEGAIAPSPNSLPLACIQAIQGVCAEALDIATISIDLDGAPITEIDNSCDFCNLILYTDEGQRRCAAAWTRLSNGQVQTCHAGLLYASAPIVVNGQLVAITAGCQFSAQPAESSSLEGLSNLASLAAELGLNEKDLRATASTVRVVPQGYLPRISRLLKRAADTYAKIGEERLELLSRLQHIAEMSKF